MAIANNVFFLPLHQHEYVTLYCLKLSVFQVTLFSSCASCQFVCDTLQWSQAYFIFFGKKKHSAETKLFPSSLFLVLVVCAARSSYRSGDAPVTAASLDSGLSGSAYSLLDEEEEANEVDSAIFQVPRL